MAHINLDRSHQADQRISWQSIPNSDLMDNSSISEIEAHHGPSLSLLSSVSKPPSHDGHDGAPAPNDESSILDSRSWSRDDAPVPNENNQLLDEDDSLSPSVQDVIASTVNTAISNQSSQKDRQSIASNSNNFNRSKPPTRNWSPYTLRRPFLVSLASVCLILSVVLAILAWYSATHHGLGKDDGSVGRFFGWRYMPTLIAVLFTQALVMIAEDVKRTEAFTRLSQTEPPTAKHTLFYIPKVWWKNVYPQQNSGGDKSWTLALSSLAAGLSLLVVSSFSSSLLIARDVLHSNPVQIRRYMPEPNGTIALVPRWDTYFRTINAHLYNVSTSTWVSDSHVILPIGPMPQVSGNETFNTGIWEAETTILQMDNNCVPMTLMQKTEFVANYTSTGNLRTCAQNATCSEQFKRLELRSIDGCSVQVHSQVESKPILKYGGIYWTNMSSSYISMQDLINEHGNRPLTNPAEESIMSRDLTYHFSDECRGRDLLLATPPWYPLSGTSDTETERLYWENFTVQAELCAPKIYEASMPVRLEVSGNISNVTFDASEFTRRRKSPPKSLFDQGRLDNLAFRETWTKYAIKSTADDAEDEARGFEGVESFLAPHYGMDIYAILRSKTLVAEASRFRSRFFGELILSSIVQADAPTLETITGQFGQGDRRIMVVTEAVITLVFSLLLALCYLSFLYWQTVRDRRALHLSVDPATIVGTASVLELSSPLTRDMRDLSGESIAKAAHILDTRVYAMQEGIVTELTSVPVRPGVKNRNKFDDIPRLWKRQRPSDHTEQRDWRPRMLKKKWLLALLVFLVVLAVVLLVLRRYAMQERLYRTAFTYKINLGLFNTTLSPHSIIATFVAVTVGLFWDSVDKPLRKLQPYLSMTRGPSATSQGALLSYQTSYWIWAAIKAARHKHWVLCLVTFGTTLTQILVVSMAAIFEQHLILQNDMVGKLGVTMTRPGVRQKPFEGSMGLASRPFYLKEGVVGVSQADWLSTALDEVMLGSPPPSWTKNEWLFPRISFSAPNGSSSGVKYFGLDALSPSANITINTPAFRSRLECSNIPVPASGWLDRAEDVFPNQTATPITGYVLPLSLFGNKTSVFSAPRRIACCTNNTDPSGTSAIAYWSSNSPLIDTRPNEMFETNATKQPNVWTTEFTIKWIIGHARTTAITKNNGYYLQGPTTTPDSEAVDRLLYFTEQPQMAAINCKPIIEHANAKIAVASMTGQVLDAKILDQPQAVDAAWAQMWDVVYGEPERVGSSSYTDINNVTTTGTMLTYPATISVSPGNLFLAQLLTAPHMIRPRSGTFLVSEGFIEDLSTERFNIRDKKLGINMDFMSRANFFLAGEDPRALLNATTLMQHSQHTFQTVFKHFTARGVATYLGGSSDRENIFWNAEGEDEYVDGTVVQHMQVLKMNETATWLSLAIIFLLVGILAGVVVSLQIVYPKTSMQHPVECLADTLIMVAGSDEFVDLVHGQGFEESGVRTRLGWFVDKRGMDRWGVEVVGRDGEE